MAGPLWRLHSFDRHEISPGRPGRRGDFIRERPEEDSVVFQLTLAGALHATWHQDGTVRDRAVTAGLVLLFGGPEEGTRYVPVGVTYHGFWMRLEGAGLRAHWARIRSSFGTVVAIAVEGSVMEVASRLIEVHEARVDPLSEAAAVHAFVIALWHELGRNVATTLSPADRGVDAILAAPHRPWSLKVVAREMGCTREHLARCFRDRVGEPPATWLRQRRLERARDLLSSTDLPVAVVVRAAGLSSVDTLARLVRCAHGCSPGELRHRAGGRRR